MIKEHKIVGDTYVKSCSHGADDAHEEVEVSAKEGSEGGEGERGGEAGGAEVRGEGKVQSIGDQHLVVRMIKTSILLLLTMKRG